MRLSAAVRRLPQLDSVALGIGHPEVEDGSVDGEFDFAAASAIRKVVEDWVSRSGFEHGVNIAHCLGGFS